MKHKHIYQTGPNTWSIDKSINGKIRHYKCFKTLGEAITYRNRLIENNWEPLPPSEEELQEKEISDYFKYVECTGKSRTYRIRNKKSEYLGMAATIEEALYFRDLYYLTPKNEVPPTKTIDLITDNPYIKEGLKYPLPERLILKEKTSTYGEGTIIQKGPTSFHIYHGKNYDGGGHHKYICACQTYEMAYYVKQEMNKVNWDRDQLQKILDNYPRYYTWLLFFYQYIIADRYNGELTGKYYLAPPKDKTGGRLEHILYYRIEDALYERDFLKEHGWDYDLLAETIDDSKNPYYDMELPPYPTRKIKNISERNYHENELTEIHLALQEDDSLSLEAAADIMGFIPTTVRRWLKQYYNSSWSEFKDISINGDNPLEVLEKQELIYQPDLSTAMPPNYNNHVSYLQKAKRWQVRKGTETYGVYPDEKLAHKISNELAKVDWDKSKLKKIQAKFGYESPVMSKRWVYKQGRKWAVRRKDKNRKMITYGVWYDKRIAEIARDMYIQLGFCLDNQDYVNEMAEWIVHVIDLSPSTMFGKSSIEDIIYLEADCYIPYVKPVPESDKVQVERYINGVRVYFGRYNEDKAREVVEFLEDNNWDKDLLKTMQELGEI